MDASRFTPQVLRRLLNPRSVAIVGASAAPGSLGGAVLANLELLRFRGEIHLINPNRDRIGWRPCLKSADLLPEDVDAAVLAIPKPHVLDTLKSLARRKTGAAIIFSAGFAEGGEQGASEQREIARIAAESRMIVEGPNCLGMVNYVDGVALTFIDVRPSVCIGLRGIGIISQSGAMAAVLGTMLAARGANVTYAISTGNEAASGVEDYLDYLLQDPRTQVIALIVEQFRHPARLLELARRAGDARKTIVLLHPGRSSAARASAATHTGALAGDYDVMRTLVGHCGVLFAESLEEFGDLLEITSRCPALRSAGTAILTESGAFKAMALDLCEQVGLPLPELNDASAPELRATLPPFVPVSNPVDLTAQALVDPGLYQRAIAALLRDPRFGCILISTIQSDATEKKFAAFAGAIRDLKPDRPILVAGVDEGACVPADCIDTLRSLGVPYFPSAERVMRALARIASWTPCTAAPANPPATPFSTPLPRGIIPEFRAKQLLRPLGIPFPEGRLAASLPEARQIAEVIGFPVVLKAQAVEISHKSDAGAVILNLRNQMELADAWTQLQNNVARNSPNASLDGVLVEKMASPGLELIIGGRNDPQWGPVVLVGFGGVQAEILRDVRLLSPHLSAAQIVSELHKLRRAKLLHGFRGSPPADTAAVAALIACVSQLLLAEPAILELDLNPVVVHTQGHGVTALDALMRIGD